MLVSEVALNVDDLVVTERNAFFILAVSTGVVALLGSIFSVWFVRQVNTPLQRLTAVAEKISRGDLVTTIPLFSTPEEIRTLAAALHRSQASMLEALQEQSEWGERLNTLLQSIVEGVVTVNPSGQVTFWSEGARNLLGWLPDEVVGHQVNEFFPLVGRRPGAIPGPYSPGGAEKTDWRADPQRQSRLFLALTRFTTYPAGGDTNPGGAGISRCYGRRVGPPPAFLFSGQHISRISYAPEHLDRLDGTPSR